MFIFDWLDGLISAPLKAGDKLISGALDATGAVVDGALNTTEAVVNTAMGVTESVVDTAVKYGLPAVAIGSQMVAGNMVGSALSQIPGPVGEVAKAYDAIDTVKGAVTVFPDYIKEVKNQDKE